MHSWLNFNGSFVKEGSPIVTASNRGLRYGDGLFETMRFVQGDIALKKLHFDRLAEGMKLLRLEMHNAFTASYIEEQVSVTILKNRIEGAARVRLMVFRGDGGLFEVSGSGGGFLIQVWPLEAQKQGFNEQGLSLGLYEGALKVCDSFSNIKSNNYLPYVMAALHAKESHLNDCLVMNNYRRICESSIANLFWVSKGRIYTPPLSEGCVDGVMRKHIIHTTGEVAEKPCELTDLIDADEIFLTNAVSGPRWVSHFRRFEKGNKICRDLYNTVMR